MNAKIEIRTVVSDAVEVVYELYRDKTITVCKFSSLADSATEAMHAFTKTCLGVRAVACSVQSTGAANVVALIISGGFDAAHLDRILRGHLAAFDLIGIRIDDKSPTDELR